MGVELELGDKDGKVEVTLSSGDWHTPLTANMFALKNEKKFCDTEIVAKDDEVLQAHSVVLAGACQLLRQTLEVASTGTGKFKIRTCEITSNTWKSLLEYMYIGTTCLNLEELDSLKDAADSLDLEELQKYCLDAVDIQKNMGAYKQKVKAENQVDQGTEIEVDIMKFAAGINETLELVMDGASSAAVSEEPAVDSVPEGASTEQGDPSKAMYLLMSDPDQSTSPLAGYSQSDSVELYANSVALPEESDITTASFNPETTKEEPQEEEEEEEVDIGDSLQVGQEEVESKRPAGSYSVHGRGRRKLSNKSMVFKCGICEKLYSSKQSLERHAVLHSGVKPFTCELCGKSFQTDRYLTAHLQRHNEERNFQCPICGKAFKTQRDANWHKNSVHSILRRFQCRYCPYTTKTRALLNQHTFSHTNPKEWVCKTCGKAFLRKQHLEQHASRHEGKRQYMCSTCGAEFYTIYACKEHHMRVHQGIKRYECSVCHQQYNEKKSFMKHLQKHSVDLVLKLDGGDIIIEQTVEDAVFSANTSDS